MDRRSLLALVACLPVLGAAPANACSLALRGPRLTGLQNSQINKLFDAWWNRNLDAFRGYFTNRLVNDGSAMDPELAKELTKLDPVPATALDIFDKFFTDTQKSKQITLMVTSAVGVLVACSEADVPIAIQPDWSGVPKLHLFFVSMSGLNPRLITHVASEETIELDRFSIWTEGAV